MESIKDLFPDLGSGFIAKLLKEYEDNHELAIAHLLDGTLPAHLDGADRAEELYVLYSTRIFPAIYGVG